MSFATSTVVRWFHALNTMKKMFHDDQYTRIVESFWASQLESKLWLIQKLKDTHLLGSLSNVPVYIYGGWYGVLGQMLYDETRTFIISVDIDADCERFGQYLAPDVEFLTEDMTKHLAPQSSVSINTSSEHITQEQYDQWMNHRPLGGLVIVQGNNFFSNVEHVRCHNTLEEFVAASRIRQIVYAGELDCGEFTRFMVIGFK